MNTLTFTHPWMLVLLWLVPLAGFGLAWWRTRRLRLIRAWLSPAMAARQPAGGGWKAGLQLGLLAAGFTLAIVALARPCYGEIREKVIRRGRDLMIVLDVSRSMLASDAAPNRLERAKADLIDLVNSLGGDRAGLILFRHKAAPVCPLTTDYGFLLQMLDSASPDSAAPGETDIGDAIRKALDALELQQSAHQAVILVSDGEDLAGGVDEAVEKAKARGITLFTVGFGSAAGSAVPDREGAPMSFNGSTVTSKLNPATLRSIAARTGGVYVPVGTARANLGDLYRDHLRKLTAREMDETVTRRRIERFTWFLLPALLCFLGAAGLSAGRPLLRGAKPAAAALLALLLFPIKVQADDSAARARTAQKDYRAGRYEEAAAAFRQAAEASPDRSGADAYYNAGCALYQAGRYKEAADLFRLAGTARPDADLPWAYNLGCAQLQDALAAEPTNAAAAKARSERLTEAAATFQETLRAANKRSGQALNNLAFADTKAKEAREKGKTLEIQEQYGGQEAGTLAQQLLERQRKLGPTIESALTNRSPGRIQQLEAAGEEARDMAGILGPLSAKLEAAIRQGGGTNAEAQVMALRRHADGLNNLIAGAADRLDDAESPGPEMMAAGERAAYVLWKAVAPFDSLLREDIRSESNLVGRLAAFQKQDPPPALAEQAAAEQAEDAELTRLFSQRFAQAIPEEGQAAPQAQPGPRIPETNQPGITKETRAKILTLAGETVVMQDDAVKAIREKDWRASGTLARESLAKLKEIEDLLPKQNQQNQQSQQDQKQDQPKQDQKNQPDQQKQPPQPKDEQPQPKPEKDMSQEKAQEVLQKARLREKEHQDEKQKRAFFDRAPGDRDW